MRIVVPIKQTPDLVEELELNDDETDVDREFLKFVLSEWDDQALEEALLVKEATGGEVVVVGFGDPDVELSLYTALAKGADKAVNLTALGEGWIDSHTRPATLAARAAARYASITRVRQGQQAGGIEEVAVTKADAGAGIEIRRLFAPEKAGHAEMLTGSPEDVADRILDLVRSKGLLK